MIELEDRKINLHLQQQHLSVDMLGTCSLDEHVEDGGGIILPYLSNNSMDFTEEEENRSRNEVSLELKTEIKTQLETKSNMKDKMRFHNADVKNTTAMQALQHQVVNNQNIAEFVEIKYNTENEIKHAFHSDVSLLNPSS